MNVKLHKKTQVIMLSCLFIFMVSLSTCTLFSEMNRNLTYYNDMVSLDDEIANPKASSSITIRNPTSETLWIPGSMQEIVWVETGSVDYVDVILLYMGDYYWTIADNTPDDGEFLWTLDSSFGHYGDYFQILICDSFDVFNYDTSPEYFEIVDPYIDRIFVTRPFEGDSYKAGSLHQIAWKSTGTISNVNIKLYFVGNLYETIATNIVNTGSYWWTLDESYTVYGLYYHIEVEDSSNPSTYDTSHGFFEIMVPHYITVTNPTAETSWQAGTTQEIRWTSIGDFSNVNIYLYGGGGGDKKIVNKAPNNGSCFWTLDSSYTYYSDCYRIKISDSNNPAIYDYSPASFEITAPDIIRVTSPTAETSWQAGSTQTITWNSTGTITNVDIDLYYLGIRSYIARNILNEGSYSWTLNTSYTYYTDYYQIRISDSNNPSTFSSSPYFEITPITHIDNITVTNPTAETSWQAGTTQTITWTSTGSITNVDIDLYYLGKNHSTIAKSTSNKGSYSWMLASYYANYTDSYQIRISDSSNPSIYGYSPTFFQITAPGGVDTITITSPTEKTSWQAGTTQNITWTSTGSISHVHIHLYHSGRYHSTIVLNTLNDGSYSWTLNSSYTDYTDSYRIRISDSSNLSTHDMSPSYFEITEKNKYAASRVDLGVEVFILIGVVSIVIVGTTSLGYISFKKHRK